MEAPKIVEDGIDVRWPGSRVAGAHRRLGAFLIDAVLVVGYLIGFPHVLAASGLKPPNNLVPVFSLLDLAVWLLPPFLYLLLMDCSPLQGTFGKYLLGIKVTDIDGNRITLSISGLRLMLKLGVTILFFPLLAIFSFAHIATTRKRQAFHDEEADTLVVLADEVPQGEPPAAGSDPISPPPQRSEGITERGGLQDTRR